MKKTIFQWAVRASAVLVVIAALRCNQEEQERTSLLLTIESRVEVSRIDIDVRNIGYEDAQISKEMGDRDLREEPLALLILPSSIIQDEFLVHVRGFRGADLVAAAAAIYEFRANEQLEETLVLIGEFNDADGDGFEACNDNDLCDCNDQNPSINPFTEEDCDDYLDNNCSGLPINEGCDCNRDQFCTPLPEQYLDLAGIGMCYFGTLACVDGALSTTCNGGTFDPDGEIPDNQLDDNCNGVVDEGSSCTLGQTRACFLGWVEPFPGEPGADYPPEIQFAFVYDMPGVRCETGLQTCVEVPGSPGMGQWENLCVDEVRPEKPDLPEIGWFELPSNPSEGVCAQCDGLDNDCNGQFDEEPWFDGDQDGYTQCGTNIDTGGDPTNPDDKITGMHPDFVDCDDSRADVNPGMMEICGNAVDEDCRCDHGDPATQIGQPYLDPPDPVTCIRPPPTCVSTSAFLECGRLPRSDTNPTGLCSDGPTECSGCEPYYHDYFGANDDCYLCIEQFGYGCSDTSGACTTQAEDCEVCDAPTPTGQTDPTLERPWCTTAGAGCTGTTPPQWEPVVGADPFEECPGVDCTGYYSDQGTGGSGIINGQCFEREDQSAADVDCNGRETCQTAGLLCPNEPAHKTTPELPPTICQEAVSGCIGTTPPNYANQPNNSDLFNQCNDNYTCDNSGAGGGPFYFGITADANGDDQCYLRANIANSSCDGGGECQDRVEACTTAPRGAIVTGTYQRPRCMTPTGGCTAETPPSYTDVPSGQDPYVDATHPNGDCPLSVDGSTDLDCYQGGACYRDLGANCTTDAQCQPGWSCVDNVCCNAPCDGECESCLNSATGLPTGQCHPVVAEQTDLNSTVPCGGSQGCGAGASNCQCDGAGTCKRGQGDTCPSGAGTCVTANCLDGYCCNDPCNGVCEACSAALTAAANGTCAPIDVLGPDVQPSVLCQNSTGCTGNDCVCKPGTSECLRDTGDVCTVGTECITGFCSDGRCCNEACNGNCDVCSASLGATADGTCTDRNTLCTGNCDTCSNGNCAANGGACSGNCSACNQVTATRFDCQANNTSCVGNCDICSGSGTTFNCAANAVSCTGNCSQCNQINATRFDCQTNQSACGGNCSDCQGSGTSFNCTANNGDCTGNCDVCTGGGTSYSCQANVSLCAGNCSQCQGSGTSFNCAENESDCSGNCSDCQGSGTTFNCASNNAACTGNCDTCSGGGTSFSCQASAGLCTGNCDVCNQVTATQFNCASNNAACTGNCDVCNQVTATRFDCGANNGACTGNCDTCSGSGTAFNCQASAGLCTGNCDVCNGGGNAFNCQANDSLCVGNCDTCAGGGTNFTCAAVPASCTGNCSTCAGSGNDFSCAANDSDCLGNCDACTGGPTNFNCTANQSGCTGNCDTCSGSGNTFNCQAVPGDCTGNCVACTGGGTDFSCSANSGACTGNCDTCSGGGTTYNCAPNAGACTGNCDTCNLVSATRYDCAASPALCTGNCDACSGSGTAFSCSASAALCTGNCDVCTGGGNEYNCGASVALCTGNCDVCNAVTATRYDCEASPALCTGNCDTCSGGGNAFNCAANDALCLGDCDDCQGAGNSFSCVGVETDCPGSCNTCGGGGTNYSCALEGVGAPGSPTCDPYLCGAAADCPGACSSNTDCVEVCIGGSCVSPGQGGDPCDTGDDADCEGSRTCLTGDVCSCLANGECSQTCIANVCAPYANSGEACDAGDDADCAGALTCSSGTCGP